jgi:putative ABC transport system ATP-binding protein
LVDVSKRYTLGHTHFEALRSVSLTVPAGQFVSVMGPSGSGKSTLLRVLSAIDSPSAGRITIAGQELGTLTDEELTLFRRRHIGLVFQFFNLIPTLTVLENVLLPVVLERRPSGTDRQHALELLASVGLADRLSNNMHQLSGGELQRVAVARALVLQPPVLLADEPTGNLDSATGAALLRLLKQTCKQRGTTIVMVTHDRHAAGIGDRLLSLRDGRIACDQLMSQTALEAS